MLEEDIIKQNIDPDDLQVLEDALVANLDGLYDSGFAEGEPLENSENTEYEGPKVVEDPETGEVYSVAPDGERIRDKDGNDASGGEEVDAPDIAEADDAIFNDINDALASQIKAEIRREKRIRKFKKSRWWLLSLIPFLGIFVLMIRPLRKNMPKWFMILRTVIFIAFSIEMIGAVVSNGRLLFYQAASYASGHMGKELKNKEFPDVKGKIEDGNGKQVLISDGYAKAKRREGFINTLFIVEDGSKDGNGNVFVALFSVDKEKGETRLVPFYPGLSIRIDGTKTTVREAVKKENFDGLLTAIADEFGLFAEGYIYADVKSLSIFVDKQGGIVINSSTFDGKKAVSYFSDSSAYGVNTDADAATTLRCYELFKSVVGSVTKTGIKDLFFHLRAAYPYMHSGISNSRLADIVQAFYKTNVVTPVYYTVPNGLNFSTAEQGNVKIYTINDYYRLKNELSAFLYGDVIREQTGSGSGSETKDEE